MKAFGSTDITVNVIAENTNMTSTGNLYVGGAFMGNTVHADGTVTAIQEVNPQVLGAMSSAYGKPGQDMLHEVTEAYQGGIISQRIGMRVGAATKANAMNPQSVYNRSHNSAVPQSGIVVETGYDRSGNIVGISNPSISRVTYSVQPKRQQPIVIMSFP